MHYKAYKSILSNNNGVNIYRGCTHGCIYCDSRSKCYHIDHPFEDIEVKENAPMMLDKELQKKRNPVMIGTGAMTDPYNHIEATLQYTRKCLEVIYKNNCGVSILTKSDMILRDMNLLSKIKQNAKVVVEMTLSTANDELCKIIEPNVCVTSKRVEVLKRCHEEGIPTIVWLCPILPFINDTKENLLKLLDYCSEAHVYGIIFFGMGLTLREGNREYFYQKLDESFPGLRKQYEKRFGLSYECGSPNSGALYKLFVSECQKRNIKIGNDELFQFMSSYPIKQKQLSIFDI